MKKYLVDTCGWIEWLINGKMVSHFEPYLKNVTRLVVPTLVHDPSEPGVNLKSKIYSGLQLAQFMAQ